MKYLSIILLFLFSLNGFSEVANIDCKKSVLVDQTNSIKIADVINSTDFKEVKNERLTFGFTPFKHWLKVECANSGESDFIGKYQFLYPVVNTLNIYRSADLKPIKLGFWEDERHAESFNTVLPQIDLNIKSQSAITFFVEAKSKGSLQLQSKIIEDNKGQTYLTKPSFIYGLFFGALLALMLYNLFLGISLRDPTYFLYCGYVIFFFMYQITITGYAPTFFGEVGYRLTDFRAAYLHLLFFFITVFANRFLLLKKNGPLLSKLLIGISSVYLLAALLSPILPTQGNLEFSAITSIVVPVILIIVAAITLKRGFKPARFFVVAWIIFLGAIVATAMRNVGLLPKIWIVDHILEFGILGEVFLISLGLAFKVRLLERDKNLAATEAANEKLKVIELNSQLEKEKIFSTVSAQVSHDIRSPLSALTMISNTLIDIPEEKRLIIRNATQRINDIANQLLLKAKADKEQSQTKTQVTLELLPSIIDVIVSEKRTQFRDKLGIEVDSDMRNSYGAFVNINSTEIKRVVSNLINNSVEAFENGKGKVLVSLNAKDDKVSLTIEDNGKGIPEHILSKLGTYGFSFGKTGTDSGSGIGIHHAKKSIESIGGTFEIQSTVGSGTKIIITLPKAPSPNWFIGKMKVVPGQHIVCLDDDVSIHQIWKGRFSSLKKNSESVEVVHLSSGQDLTEWVSKNNDVVKDTTFLVDYELLGQNASGLDLIENLKIGPNSILVTSRFEEISIRTRCEKNGVKLIPKGMASLVPIEFVKISATYDACLIDDDPLVRLTWEIAARDSNAKLLTFDSLDSFIEAADEINPSTSVSIDVNLGDGVKGTDVALKLHKMGFTKLYLATGYEPENIADVPSCVVAVRGKEPQFI